MRSSRSSTPSSVPPQNHHKSQQELIHATKGFRARGLPLDAIVQDWHYWGKRPRLLPRRPPPPHPLYPPNTVVAAAAASPGFSLSGDCEGIVCTDDGYCHLYNRNLIRMHSDEDPSTSCTSSLCSNVKGRHVYTMPAPPPPPHVPASAACRPFEAIHDETVMASHQITNASTVTAADGDGKCLRV